MVRLVPMTQEEYSAWYDASVRDYAEEKARAGNWHASEAQRLSEEAFARLLPNGLYSEGQHLYMIEDEAVPARVGVIWLAEMHEGPQPWGWVYDVVVFEEHRRRGYGEAAFRALEEKAAELGLQKIALQVFGHNHPARALYEKLGYKTTNIVMEKEMPAGENPR